jgi:hypothetical protein
VRRTFLSLALLAAASLCTTIAQADTWPSKPIKAIVPFAPGSATDQIGRAFAAEMARTLGQPIIADNRPGVNGMLGASEVAKATADGYTILIGTNSTNAALKSLMKQLPYNQDTAFAPLGYMGSVPLIVAVNNDVPAKNLHELVPRCWPAWPAAADQRALQEWPGRPDRRPGMMFTADFAVMLPRVKAARRGPPSLRPAPPPSPNCHARGPGPEGRRLIAYFAMFAPAALAGRGRQAERGDQAQPNNRELQERSSRPSGSWWSQHPDAPRRTRRRR